MINNTSGHSRGSMTTSHNDDGSHNNPPLSPSSSTTASARSLESSSEQERQQLLRKHEKGGKPLEPPVLVYHESARSIVFRDHLRRKVAAETKTETENNNNSNNEERESTEGETKDNIPTSPGGGLQQDLSDIGTLLFPDQLPDVNSGGVEIPGFQPNIVPLPSLQLGPNDEYLPLWESDSKDKKWNEAEIEVVEMLEKQRAVVKTIKNTDWTSFLRRFITPETNGRNFFSKHHRDIPPSSSSSTGDDGTSNDDHHDHHDHHDHNDNDYTFNSFVTSTTLLPSGGKKMRCYGKPNLYTTGIVFALPKFGDEETEQRMADETKTWSWPAGYSAKTEFNIDSHGNLINGRQEALVQLSQLRDYNADYLTKEDYMIAGRILKGGLNTVPYNEVLVRVGGRGRIVNNTDCATGHTRSDSDGTGRSFQTGVGLPIALFVRTASFGHLISLLRTRARLIHIWGERHVQGIPLLLISTELGVRVLTDSLQKDLLKIAAQNLNPFQNPMIAHKTTIDDTEEKHLETKLEELIDLDESIRGVLTPEECAKLAGGFGATDDSIAQILKDACIRDKQSEKEGNAESAHMLQDIVNEGLAAAVRSGDYYTSRQLLILYSLVASEKHQMDMIDNNEMKDDSTSDNGNKKKELLIGEGGGEHKKSDEAAMLLERQTTSVTTNGHLPPPPPPPPLDTDRLRSATNSDGLLAVLGAAQVLKAMRDGGAKKRTQESFLAVEEWCEYGEQSMAFRLASWRDQKSAQSDLKIAYEQDSSFMAFVSNKAISNRKNFAKQLREATAATDFTDVRFLTAIYEMVCRMHSPCLRLELLQYVLGLDNRYSIAHVKRSIELAATCLSISQNSR